MLSGFSQINLISDVWAKSRMVVAMWVKKEEESREGGGVVGVARPASSRSDTELLESSSRQSRREIYETSKTAEREVTKSKSMSLKSQLKSPFKFLGKTYCGGCKVTGANNHQSNIFNITKYFYGRKYFCFIFLHTKTTKFIYFSRLW